MKKILRLFMALTVFLAILVLVLVSQVEGPGRLPSLTRISLLDALIYSLVATSIATLSAWTLAVPEADASGTLGPFG